MIGVFDSGIGGLTVLKSLANYFPEESFLYLGDTARLPYGTKSNATIRKYSEQIMNFLCEKNVKALVIACNTASSQVPETHWPCGAQSIPVYTVIAPGSQKSLQVTQNGNIGVLGTRATIQSEMYPKLIQSLAASSAKIPVQIFTQACPLFVPLAEEGLIDDPLTNLIAYRYLQPLLINNIDTLILGCTHYPLLKNSLQRACGANVTLVDSGEALCERLEQDFKNGALQKSVGRNSVRTIEILCTDFSAHMQNWALEILEPLTVTQFQAVDL